MNQKNLEYQSHRTRTVQRANLKIEDKLMNYKIQSIRKLEILKQSLEMEMLKELQNKPKILKKSRILAENYDKKIFEVNRPSRTLTNTPAHHDTQFENDKKDPPCIITVKSIAYSSNDPAHPKHQRPKSAQTHSIIEKSKDWVRAQKAKIQDQRTSIEKNVLAECTLSPSMLKKPLKRSEKPFKEETTTPQSIETHADSTDHPKKLIKTCAPRNLTPFQQKIWTNKS